MSSQGFKEYGPDVQPRTGVSRPVVDRHADLQSKTVMSSGDHCTTKGEWRRQCKEDFEEKHGMEGVESGVARVL